MEGLNRQQMGTRYDDTSTRRSLFSSHKISVLLIFLLSLFVAILMIWLSFMILPNSTINKYEKKEYEFMNITSELEKLKKEILAIEKEYEAAMEKQELEKLAMKNEHKAAMEREKSAMKMEYEAALEKRELEKLATKNEHKAAMEKEKSPMKKAYKAAMKKKELEKLAIKRKSTPPDNESTSSTKQQQQQQALHLPEDTATTSITKHNNNDNNTQQRSSWKPAIAEYNNDCWWGMVEIPHHKFKKGMYGAEISFSSTMPGQNHNSIQQKICQSRYYILQDLLRILVDIGKQANVTMVLAYGTLLSYHRYQDIMLWDPDADIFVLQREMDDLYTLIQQQQIVIPDHVGILLRRDRTNSTNKCDHPLAFYHKQTGFYVDVMRLEEINYGSGITRSRGVQHHIYKIPISSYYPLNECQLGDITGFKCPNKILDFIGPPGRDYKWKDLQLDDPLKPCPYYKQLHQTKWNDNNMTQIRKLFGDYLDPQFDWLH